MKWIRFCSAVVATLGLTTVAQADILDLFEGFESLAGSGKSCGCASSCQPCCCKPTITRPCDYKVHTYQRKVSDIKPPCCNKCCAPKTCCAPARCCAPKTCCAPKKSCAPQKCCAPKKCYAPKTCCAPKKSCCTSSCCDSKGFGLLDRLFNGHSKGVCYKKVKSCCADPCEIAELIYQSQTACYARDRERAIDDLGDFDCTCNPEIIVAMIYALNDASEEVRAEAADEIGDQLRKNPCCCSKEVVAALTCALADCDRDVRKQAEEGLEACGYCVVDGCCCCKVGCNSCGGAGHGSPTPAPQNGAKPAPAPPEDPKAYFPSRLRRYQSSRPARNVSRLSNLFGLID